MVKLQPSSIKLFLLDLLLPLTLVVVAFLEVPFYRIFEFDNDEGFNLMKAFLYWKGFDLYTEIWSDQPPVLTVILAFLFKVFGASVFASRLLILCFSALLIWSFYQILRRRVGRVSAAIASLLLIVSGSFLRLSVSVMVGLPSIALALFSTYLLAVYKSRKHRLLVAFSGIVMALSLQTKLFTIFLIPLLIFILLDSTSNEGAKRLFSRERLFTSGLWLACFGAVYGLIGLACHSFNYDQLVQAHLQEQIKDEFQTTNGWQYLLSLIQGDYDLVLLSGAGIFAISRQRNWQDLFPIAWLLTALLLLMVHRPIWYHHYVLITIPLAWLSAYGIDFIVQSFKSIKWRSQLHLADLKRLFVPTLALLLFVISVASIPAKLSVRQVVPSTQWEIVDILKKHKDQTQWVFSDRPIIAFYAGLPIPPEIAVLSRKRRISGNFTFDDLLDVLQTYRPEQIVLARQTKELRDYRKIKRFLKRNYTRIYAKAYSKSNKDAIAEHYLINTIVNQSF